MIIGTRNEEHFIIRPKEIIGTSSAWLRGFLASKNLVVNGSCKLLTSLDHLDQFVGRLKRGDFEQFNGFGSADEAYAYFGEIWGVDLLSKALHWATLCGLEVDPPHLKAIIGGNPIVTAYDPRSSKDRNLSWEVLIACLASTFCDDVRFEEPDVVCSYRGQRFVISAKVAYSSNKVFRIAMNGLKQANGKGDFALVFINVVNLYPVVETLRWSVCKQFRATDPVSTQMQASLARWCLSQFDTEGPAKKMLHKRKQPFGVAFFTPMLIHAEDCPRLHMPTHFPIAWNRTIGLDYAFATQFSRACDDVSGFVDW